MNRHTSTRRSCWFVLVCCHAMGLAACVTVQESPHSQKYRETTTLEAYTRAEKKLATVQQGDALEDLKLKGIGFSAYAVKSFGMATGENFVAEDGWIEDQSGGYLGGLFGTGALISVSAESAIGSHLFGYVEKDTYIIPKYELQIVGDIVSQEEYTALSNTKVKNIGIFASPPGGARIWAKNLRVHEVKRLDFPPEPDLSRYASETTSVLKHFTSKLTPAEFEKAKTILEKMPPGTDYYGVIRALDGWWFCLRRDGRSCPLWMSGFLNLKDQFRFSAIKTGDAVYQVWPFGYLDPEQNEMPKLALILRNNKVSNLVPYTDRASVEAQLRP